MLQSLYFSSLIFVSYFFGKVFCENVHFGNNSYNPSKHKNYNNIAKIYCIDNKVCVRKCCDIGYTLEGKECIFNNLWNFTVPIYNETEKFMDFFYPIVGLMDCKNDYFALINDGEFLREFFLLPNGQLQIEFVENTVHQNQFCVDYSLDSGSVSIVCSHSNVVTTNSIGMLISIPFLLVTFLVYFIIPERNLHKKCLMCYVITLCFAYTFLVTLQLETNMDDISCNVLGFLCFFCFLASFFWMNVMCIDIWWTFSGIRGLMGSKKLAEQKRFILYSCYAWGIPFLIVSIVLLFRFGGFVSETSWYYPGIGHQQCWFSGELQTLLYFYGPMTILIAANVILFIITAIKIQQVKRDTAMLRKDESKRHSYENDKQRFNLYVKLLMAMGINWTMEIISFFCGWQGNLPDEVWYLTDFCNACYGVFIFFIFVFKKTIWTSLKKRYYTVIGKPYLARTLTTHTTPRTATSTVSYTNTNNTDSTAMIS